MSDIEGLRARTADAVLSRTEELVAVVALDEDAGYPVVLVNEAFCSATGWSREELLDRPAGELQPPEVVASFVRHAEEAVATGSVRYQVEREVPEGRQSYDVQLVALPELGDDPPHLVSITHDVTALRRTTESLAEIQELADIGLWVWDIEHDRIRWSSGLYAIYGLDRRDFEASYEAYLGQIHPDDREHVDATVRRARATGEDFEVEHRVVRGDGEVRWVHGRGRVTLGPDGEPIRMAGTAQDVTRQRLTEQRLSAVFDHIQGFLGIMDPDGTLVQVNRAPLAASGLSEDEVLGRPFWETAGWSPSDEVQQRLREDIAAARRGEQVRRDSRYFTASGEVRWVDRCVSPVTDEHGEVVLLVAEGRDITEERTRDGAEARAADAVTDS